MMLMPIPVEQIRTPRAISPREMAEATLAA
jgi:hypothetical protein